MLPARHHKKPSRRDDRHSAREAERRTSGSGGGQPTARSAFRSSSAAGPSASFRSPTTPLAAPRLRPSMRQMARDETVPHRGYYDEPRVLPASACEEESEPQPTTPVQVRAMDYLRQRNELSQASPPQRDSLPLTPSRAAPVVEERKNNTHLQRAAHREEKQALERHGSLLRHQARQQQEMAQRQAEMQEQILLLADAAKQKEQQDLAKAQQDERARIDAKVQQEKARIDAEYRQYLAVLQQQQPVAAPPQPSSSSAQQVYPPQVQLQVPQPQAQASTEPYDPNDEMARSLEALPAFMLKTIHDADPSISADITKRYSCCRTVKNGDCLFHSIHICLFTPFSNRRDVFTSKELRHGVASTVKDRRDATALAAMKMWKTILQAAHEEIKHAENYDTTYKLIHDYAFAMPLLSDESEDFADATRQQVYEAMMDPSRYWGDQYAIHVLEKRLNIRIFVVYRTSKDTADILLATNTHAPNPKWAMLLYQQGGNHYMPIIEKEDGPVESYLAAYRLDNLPPFFGTMCT